MGNFGLVTPDLPAAACWKRWPWIPQGWRYREGFAFAGRLSGYLGDQPVEGWGWAVPRIQARAAHRLWETLEREWAVRPVSVVGVEGLPVDRFKVPAQVGLSDGKALELLVFTGQFRNILRHYGINPQTAEITVMWEEGNLGLACSRLIAQHLRFLRLIHPDAGRLDHAAAVIMAETGISPKVQQVPPEQGRHIAMVIRCGTMKRYRAWNCPPNTLDWELFAGQSDWFRRLTGEGFFTVWGPSVSLPTSPVLGEVLIRAVAGWSLGHWVGCQLRLERIVQMKQYLSQRRIAALAERFA